MIVMHGLLGNKYNLRGIVSHETVRTPILTYQIASKRNCYLVEMRNHAESDHHDDMNYRVISEDIIRFADRMGLEKFTVLGHSLGGRSAMTVAARYPKRVDGCIVIDAAPADEV